MNYDSPYQFNQSISDILNKYGISVHKVGFYLHYLFLFCIQAKLANRSLSTDELEALGRHLTFDSNRWGISESAVRDLTREKFKFLTVNVLRDILTNRIDQGKFNKDFKKYITAKTNKLNTLDIRDTLKYARDYDYQDYL
jgi:hypothetical protein